MLPNLFVVTGLLCLAGYPVWRITAVGVTLALTICGAWIEGHSMCSRRAKGPPELIGMAVGMMCAHALLIGLTGGLFSPLLPSLVAGCVAAFHIFGKSQASGAVLLGTVGLVGLFALLPREAMGPRVTAPYDVVLMAWSLLHAMVILRGVAFYVQGAHQRTNEALNRAREDLLATSMERAKSLEAISSRVAHELKNPLASIKALVRLVRKGATERQTQERLDVVENEVTRMEKILRDYLSFSRPLEELKPQPVELGVLADDVIAALEGRASAAGVDLSRKPSSSTIVGDPRRLKEALLNLIGNAVEATPNGGKVEVSVREHDGGARIVIKDSGRGMNDAELARIGTPFFTTREGGTGLGIVLARSVVSQHGGTLEYASESGKGTTATVFLPYRPLGTENLPVASLRSRPAN
jgi:signal transduction histidine kinase